MLLFIAKVIKYRNTLPRKKVMESLSLEIFKTWLEMALSNLLQLALLSICWTRWSPEVCFNLSCSVIQWIETPDLLSKALTRLKESRTICSDFSWAKKKRVFYPILDRSQVPQKNLTEKSLLKHFLLLRHIHH